MARKLETTLWQLVKADGKSRYVKVRTLQHVGYRVREAEEPPKP